MKKKVYDIGCKAKYLKVVAVASMLLTAVPTQVSALDESRLWLPKSHERIYLNLKKSAEAAEALDRCHSVVRGTIDLTQSTKEYPIFRIMCRQANGRTYNEMVNGLTFEPLTTKAPSLEEIDVDKILQDCLVVLEQKTQLFIDKKMVDDEPKPEVVSLERVRFNLDFDAKNMNGASLRYRAVCNTEKEGPSKVKIKMRPAE